MNHKLLVGLVFPVEVTQALLLHIVLFRAAPMFVTTYVFVYWCLIYWHFFQNVTQVIHDDGRKYEKQDNINVRRKSLPCILTQG